MSQAEAALEAAQQVFGSVVKGLKEVKWQNLPMNTRAHIEKNPKMTAFQIVALLTAVVPGLLAAPVLGAIGFSSLGPVAGESI